MTRRLAGVPFEHFGGIDANRDASGALVLETPHERFANPRSLRLNAYGAGPFARLKVGSLPKSAGVYALFDSDDHLVYVGRARDSLAERWGRRGYSVIDPRNCFVGGQSTNCRINGLVTQALIRGETLGLWAHEEPDPVVLEARLIRELRPPWNLR